MGADRAQVSRHAVDVDSLMLVTLFTPEAVMKEACIAAAVAVLVACSSSKPADKDPLSAFVFGADFTVEQIADYAIPARSAATV